MKKILAILLSVLLLLSMGSGTVGAQEDITMELDVTWEDGQYQISSGEETYNRAEIKLAKNITYVFNVDAPGQPFHISEDQSLGADYDEIWTTNIQVDGSTEGMLATEEGTLTFSPDSDTPDTLYYKSSETQDAGGIIDITEEFEPPSNVDDTYLPVLIGDIGGIPFWVIGGVISTGILAGFFFGRSSDEIDWIN